MDTSTAPHPPLPVDEVHIWTTDADVPLSVEVEQACFRLLDEREREKYRRFHFEADRRRYLVTHALARTVLARYVSMPPETLPIRISASGKPYLDLPASCEPIEFSLSHTRGLVGCIVTRGLQCGFDVEHVHAIDDTDAISAYVFSGKEIAQLSQLSSAERERAFFRLWTLKEAYAKALGIGLDERLTLLSFSMDRGKIVCFDEAVGKELADWSFFCSASHAGHALAVAVYAGNTMKDLVFREFAYFSHS